MQAARALRVNVTVGEQQLQQHLLPPQLSCDQEMVFFMETVLAMLLLVGLVWLLNRDDRDGPTPDSFAHVHAFNESIRVRGLHIPDLGE